MLSDIQQAVRRIVAQLPEAERFALAGGAALIVSGVIDRLTKDLDFFTPYPNPVGGLAEAIQTALEDAGLAVVVVRASDTYAQLQVSSGGDTTNIDLASDHRMMDATPTETGYVLDVQELAADKVLALEARGVPRDYFDFAALSRWYSIDQMCQLAGQKDTGFDVDRLAGRLRRFSELAPEVFGLADEEYADLGAAITGALGDLEHLIAAQEQRSAKRASDKDAGTARQSGHDIGL
ncbi:MAG: nucleotidyl transferase AbiEii/AbiGii toxin family protein [Acidimicrobiia bacterium]|nr:nucleotidyl transferase AbiEii/AbiGii toxin family protein [Acidimicrobiia bacterium]MCY4432448.1 nucleotidyl transferase AbiEii/AbiGii toxin family protein [bacterium]